MIWIVVLIVVSIISWLFIISRLSKLPVFTISNIEVYGTDPDLTSSIRASVASELEGDYFGLFSKSNFLLYSYNTILNRIMNISPRLLTSSVERKGLHSLYITIGEKNPAALICSNLPNFDQNKLIFDDSDTCYFADEDGLIFKPAPAFSGHVYNRYYIPALVDVASSPDEIIGHYATSTTEFKSLQKFYDDVVKSGIVGQAIFIKDAGEYELYAHNPNVVSNSKLDSDTVVIYFNNLRSFSEQLVNLLSFWANLSQNARIKNKPILFDSIDVRYGSNVFYR